MSNFPFKAFISYAHTDEKWAKWLHRSLETYRVPRRVVAENALGSNRLIPIFRDRDELTSSGDLSAAIQTALTESENLIVICSPASAQSRWVNEEIKLFKQLGKGDRVFCLLIGDPAESFPPMALVDVDGDGIATAEETEPLAADARPIGEGRHGAKIKIAAALLSVRLDRLRRREVQRRNRRLLAIAVATTAGMLVSTGLTVYAFEQRERAITESETSRVVTDFLLSIFKQSKPGFYRGTEPSARDILDQGATRVRHELRDLPEVRARLMAAIGSAYLGIAQGNEALALLSDALELQEGQLGPNHLALVPTLQDLAEAEAVYQGDREAANRLNLRAVQIQERQGGHNSAELVNILIRTSVFASGEEIDRLLNRALEVAASADPQSRSHGKVLRYLAYHSLEQNNLEDSRLYLEQALEIQRTRGYDQELIETLNALGSVFGYMEQYDRSLSMLAQAVTLSEDVYGVDHPWTAAALNDLAVEHHILGKLDQARPLYERVLTIAEDSLGPHSGLRRTTLTNLGELERDSGAFPEAESIFEETASLYLETVGVVPPYLTGQIALLRLAQKRYDDAIKQFDRYFESAESTRQGPEYAPIVEGYEQLLAETGRAPTNNKEAL